MRPSYDNHAATIALRWPEHAVILHRPADDGSVW